MNQEQEIRRGFEAERLMEEPLLKEAFTAIEARIVDELKRVNVGSRDMQRDLIVTLQLLNGLKRHIAEHIDTGKLARIAKESTRDRIRRVVG